MQMHVQMHNRTRDSGYLPRVRRTYHSRNLGLRKCSRSERAPPRGRRGECMS